MPQIHNFKILGFFVWEILIEKVNVKVTCEKSGANFQKKLKKKSCLAFV